MVTAITISLFFFFMMKKLIESMNQKLFFPHGRDSFFLHCGAFCCKMRVYVHEEAK